MKPSLRLITTETESSRLIRLMDERDSMAKALRDLDRTIAEAARSYGYSLGYCSALRPDQAKALAEQER